MDMAFAWLDRKDRESGEWSGFLEKGVSVEGRLDTTGTFRIDSPMKGTLTSDEKLIVGENARIEGQMEGNYIVIAGRFDGTIKAKGRVEIQPKAIVTGEIHTPCLIIEPGAVFDGRCHMLATNQAAKTITIPIRSAASA
jgi:cytoskeletal protein CcmA (bactofilin family)